MWVETTPPETALDLAGDPAHACAPSERAGARTPAE